MNKNVAFHTLGCKVNYFETEGVWESFHQAGYTRVDFANYANVYVINTCSVTNGGDKKSRQFIRRAIGQNPDAIICVMGCHSQTNPDISVKIPGVDIVIGTSGRHQLVAMVEEFWQTKQPINRVGDIMKTQQFESLTVTKFANRQRGVLKIQDGCNNFCSFCIIPLARGPVRSEQPEKVIANACQLVENGHQEIVLTGIHTGAYGEDLPNYTFADLLAALVKIDGLKRLRISSIEATELTDDVLLVLASSAKFANHLHIPLQSGTDPILKAMNRKYNLAEFENKIKKIRTALPEVAITTDMIVGFPGEDEALFNASVATAQRIGFAKIHVFGYSARNKTVAAKLPNQIPEAIKSTRVNALIATSQKLANAYACDFNGRILDIIVEQVKDGQATGRASNYLSVKFPVATNFDATVAQVRIVKAGYPVCLGILV